MLKMLQSPRAKVAVVVAGGIIAFEACSLLTPRNEATSAAVPPAKTAAHSHRRSKKAPVSDAPASTASADKTTTAGAADASATGKAAAAAPGKAAGDAPAVSASASASAGASASAAGNNVVVHVAGRVHHPDVYSLPAAERVIDAVRLAGGALPDADLDSVNLAAHLEDGEQIYVPPRGAAADLAGDSGSARTSRAAVPSLLAPPGGSWNQMSPGMQLSPLKRPRTGRRSVSSSQAALLAMSLAGPAGRMPMAGPLGAQMAVSRTRRPRSSKTPGSGSRGGNKLKNPSQGIVNLNRANQADLVRLPGVGPSTATRILEFRQANGPFTTVEDVMNVKGIGPSKFAKMRPFITVG